jgi:signal transduction histidine kinase
MKKRSLKLRLLALQAVLMVIALGLTGYGLTYLFERHLERRLGAELDTYLLQIAARVKIDEDATPVVGAKLADPRFEKIYSGLYWQINNETAKTTSRSRSLWDVALNLPSDQPGLGTLHRHTIAGPDNAKLIVHERRVALQAKNHQQIVRIAVALDRAELQKLATAFSRDVATALALLGAFLLAAGWIQISFGLQPLKAIRQSIADIRTGKAARLSEDLPSEIAPLGHEVNKLLAAQETAIEQARHRANDLAHGFKTPLTALKTDVQRLRQRGEKDIAADIENVSQAMMRQIERELTTARVRHARKIHKTPLHPIFAGVIATLERTPDGEGKAMQLVCQENLMVNVDEQDLQDIVGNLLENAVKFSTRQIAVLAEKSSTGVNISIADDGPGIGEKMRKAARQRGVRLDESVSGTGLGLAIVSDLLAIYGSRLDLSESPTGGLQVSFSLPSSV